MSTETPERTPIAVPTPELIADSLTSGDGEYHEGHDWWESLTSDGNVVHIGITPTDEDGERCEKVRFEAHVFAVEPPGPVAAGPVELPAEVARELAYEKAGRTFEGWTVVENEQTGSDRWMSHYDLVIRNADGEHFSAWYQKGLTEYQDVRPWEGEKTARFEPVERRMRVVRVVEWVPPAVGGAA
jgi:hypothetical protein